VALALTKFPSQVGKLYAADLAGAALGCVLVIYLLKVTDGPTAVIAIAGLAMLGAIFFIAETGRTRLMQVAVLSAVLLALFAAGHTWLVQQQSPWLRLIWVKGELESRPLFEAWNSFSRIRVSGNPNTPEYPFGWGLSRTYVDQKKVRQIHMNIDATAGTVMTGFDGNLESLEHLKYDMVNVAHYLRPNSDVLVVGAGGGRDVLSALAFKQKSVVGVEINENILKIVNQKFGDFTGHLDQYPQVTFVNDEARSYIARLKTKVDIIQISLIDSWAATAAGAFVLSENSLYTLEAWQIFLEHLKPGGILTVSRWYFRDLPAEMYRSVALASAALRQVGVENPRDHIIIMRRMRGEGAEGPDGIGTMLISKDPFSAQDITTVEEIVAKGGLELVFSPDYALDPTFITLTTEPDLSSFFAEFLLDITPSTDNKPFFFHMLRFRDIFNPDIFQGKSNFNVKAVSTLGVLLLTVTGLTFLCIIIPLALTTQKQTLRGSLPFFLFFAGIGLGFMLVEISQMQRLIVFLGHPTYSLSTVLFTLLLSSGLGSFLTQKINVTGLTRPALRNLLLLLGVLIIFGGLTPYVISYFQAATTVVRILVSVAILFPPGLLMGMAFPLGMSLAAKKAAALTPWLWGINGATSVCASVLAVVVAMNWGIATAFWAGFLCYTLAFAAFVWASWGTLSLKQQEQIRHPLPTP
jgi:spermidine synthase